MWSPMMQASAPVETALLDRATRDELAAIVAALQDGPKARRSLRREVGSTRWGPGRFRSALRAGLATDVVRRTGRGTYALGRHD